MHTAFSAVQLFIVELRTVPVYARAVLQQKVQGYMARAEQLSKRLNPLEDAKAHALKAIQLDGQNKLDSAYDEYKKSVEALLKAVKMPHNQHLKPVSLQFASPRVLLYFCNTHVYNGCVCDVRSF